MVTETPVGELKCPECGQKLVLIHREYSDGRNPRHSVVRV